MPRHASNADRIARAAAEAAARAREKSEAKAARAARPPSARALRAPRAPQRMKIVWAVGRAGESPLGTFPYPERAAAEADAVRRGKGWSVRPLKVPME